MKKEHTDLVAKHLEELKAFMDTQIAARFEVVAARDRLRDPGAANEPWLEVRWRDDERLQVKLMTLKPSNTMPDAWEQIAESTWLIPMSASAGLAEWINREWLHTRGTTNKTLRMWTE